MAHEPKIEIDIADKFGETPLMIAVKKGNAKIVMTCLNKKCNPFCMNDEGQTVLDIANDLPEDSDKEKILQFLKDAINN